MSLIQQVRELSERGFGSAEIARRTGAARQRVHEYLCRIKKAEHYKAVHTARRRRLGQRPWHEYRHDLEQRRQGQLARIEPLLAHGMSWGKAAKTLGVTKGVVAGHVFRARQREQRRAA